MRIPKILCIIAERLARIGFCSSRNSIQKQSVYTLTNQNQQPMTGLFAEINKEEEERQEEIAEETPTELPEAFQVCTSIKQVGASGKPYITEEIITTYNVDRKNGIVPIEKAKAKARAMKNVFPDKTFYVVGIYKRIEATY